jgi:hypothetical protein
MNDTVARSASSITRRAVVGGASAIAVALGLGHRLGPGGASAQDATPTPNPDGVAGELLGADVPTIAQGAELAVGRTTIAPGGGLPPHSHPGAIVFAVDAGTWGYTPLEGTIRVMRAAGDGTPAAVEEPPMGVELILTKGDALFAEASRDQMRNAGEDDVVLLLAALTPAGQDIQTD